MLRKATEFGPEIAEAHFYLGVALILQKQHIPAASCFRKATDLKPDFALAYYNLGHGLKEQGTVLMLPSTSSGSQVARRSASCMV